MATETLRPNADGDNSECDGSDGDSTNNYALVDETSANDADYVYDTSEPTAWLLDLYNLPATAIPAGSTINKITFYARFMNGALADYCKFAYKSGGTTYYSSAPNITNSYAEYFWEQTTNQKTSAAFTIDEINALQIGFSLYSEKIYHSGRCSQLWIVIDYTEGKKAKIIIF